MCWKNERARVETVSGGMAATKRSEVASIPNNTNNQMKRGRTFREKLDAADIKYYSTVLAPGQALRFPYPVRFTPGEDRATSWQRTGGSNLVPDGKYQLTAVFTVNRKDSQWKGELTSGALAVEIHPSTNP